MSSLFWSMEEQTSSSAFIQRIKCYWKIQFVHTRLRQQRSAIPGCHVCLRWSSLWTASWLPPSLKDQSVSAWSHWEVRGHPESLVKLKRSNFHFNVAQLIYQRCNVQDKKALSDLHISPGPCAFNPIIVTITLHISLSIAPSAITVLQSHSCQPLRRLEFVGCFHSHLMCVSPPVENERS